MLGGIAIRRNLVAPLRASPVMRRENGVLRRHHREAYAHSGTRRRGTHEHVEHRARIPQLQDGGVLQSAPWARATRGWGVV